MTLTPDHPLGKRKTRVFVAMPYEGVDQVANVARAIDIGEELASRGFVPFIPHLCHLWQLRIGHPVEFWRGLMLEMIGACDCMLVYGWSAGVQAEDLRARDLGLPVFVDIDALEAGIGKERDED